MPFTVTNSIADRTTLVHLKHEGTAATIIPSAGAMLHAFTIQTSDGLRNLIDSYPADLAVDSTGDWFKGVKLSPWPCRIPSGVFEFEGTEYKLSKLFRDGTALHGLLFDQPFSVLEELSDESCATVVLQHEYFGEDPGYPFSYLCVVKYVLRAGNELEIETTIRNLSDQNIPIADGWHPYFQLGGKVDDWNLKFPSKSIVEFNEKLIPTGRLLPYDHFNRGKTIGEIDLDNCFVIDKKSDEPVCMLSNPQNGISILFFVDDSYPYLQIFIPPYRTSIAIENLSAIPNEFNNKIGLVTLAMGETKTFRVFYKVELNEKN